MLRPEVSLAAISRDAGPCRIRARIPTCPNTPSQHTRPALTPIYHFVWIDTYWSPIKEKLVRRRAFFKMPRLCRLGRHPGTEGSRWSPSVKLRAFHKWKSLLLVNPSTYMPKALVQGMYGKVTKTPGTNWKTEKEPGR